MAKPFKFRYVNEIAGAFTSAIVIALVVGIVLAGRAQKWFESSFPIVVEMPPEGAYGLKTGDEVHMFGTRVGAVDDIIINAQTGKMTAACHVESTFAKFILVSQDHPETGSKAIIHPPLVAIGETNVEITTTGTQGSPITRGGTLPAAPETGYTDAINSTVSDVRMHTLPAIEALLQEYTKLAADLRSPHGPVQETFAHLDAVSANLQRSDSVLGRLTTDKELADRLDQAITKLTASTDDVHRLINNLEETTAELPKIAHSASSQVDKLPQMVDQTSKVMAEAETTLKDLEATTAQLPAVVASLKETVDTLPGVMVHTQQTLIEVQKLVKGMQNLPLIRENVDHTVQAGTLQPTDAGGPP
jgi:ABC-type transporter Mla subunit MlaD